MMQKIFFIISLLSLAHIITSSELTASAAPAAKITDNNKQLKENAQKEKDLFEKLNKLLHASKFNLLEVNDLHVALKKICIDHAKLAPLSKSINELNKTYLKGIIINFIRYVENPFFYFNKKANQDAIRKCLIYFYESCATFSDFQDQIASIREIFDKAAPYILPTSPVAPDNQQTIFQQLIDLAKKAKKVGSKMLHGINDYFLKIKGMQVKKASTKLKEEIIAQIAQLAAATKDPVKLKAQTEQCSKLLEQFIPVIAKGFSTEIPFEEAHNFALFLDDIQKHNPEFKAQLLLEKLCTELGSFLKIIKDNAEKALKENHFYTIMQNFMAWQTWMDELEILIRDTQQFKEINITQPKKYFAVHCVAVMHYLCKQINATLAHEQRNDILMMQPDWLADLLGFLERMPGIKAHLSLLDNQEQEKECAQLAATAETIVNHINALLEKINLKRALITFTEQNSAHLEEIKNILLRLKDGMIKIITDGCGKKMSAQINNQEYRQSARSDVKAYAEDTFVAVNAAELGSTIVHHHQALNERDAQIKHLDAMIQKLLAQIKAEMHNNKALSSYSGILGEAIQLVDYLRTLNKDKADLYDKEILILRVAIEEKNKRANQKLLVEQHIEELNELLHNSGKYQDIDLREELQRKLDELNLAHNQLLALKNNSLDLPIAAIVAQAQTRIQKLNTKVKLLAEIEKQLAADQPDNNKINELLQQCQEKYTAEYLTEHLKNKFMIKTQLKKIEAAHQQCIEKNCRLPLYWVNGETLESCIEMCNILLELCNLYKSHANHLEIKDLLNKILHAKHIILTIIVQDAELASLIANVEKNIDAIVHHLALKKAVLTIMRDCYNNYHNGKIFPELYNTFIELYKLYRANPDTLIIKNCLAYALEKYHSFNISNLKESAERIAMLRMLCNIAQEMHPEMIQSLQRVIERFKDEEIAQERAKAKTAIQENAQSSLQKIDTLIAEMEALQSNAKEDAEVQKEIIKILIIQKQLIQNLEHERIKEHRLDNLLDNLRTNLWNFCILYKKYPKFCEKYLKHALDIALPYLALCPGEQNPLLCSDDALLEKAKIRQKLKEIADIIQDIHPQAYQTINDYNALDKAIESA